MARYLHFGVVTDTVQIAGAETVTQLRGMRYQRAELPLKLDGLETAREFFAGCLAEQDPARETLWVAHVDDRARCMHVSYHEGDRAAATFPFATSFSMRPVTTAPELCLPITTRVATRARATAIAVRRGAWLSRPRRSIAPCSITSFSRATSAPA